MNENNHYASGQQQQRKIYSPSSKQVKMVSALWDRMTRLYGYKWTGKEGELDVRSYGFKLWCEKTDDLGDDQWLRALNRCEKDLINAGKEGREMWPPSYAEFIGFAQPEKAPSGAYRVFAPALPISDDMKASRKAAAEKGCQKLMSMFEDEE